MHTPSILYDPSRGLPVGTLEENPFTDSVVKKTASKSQVYGSCELLFDEILSTQKMTGAALALLADRSLVCVASRGGNAPPVGSCCDQRTGLTGKCFTSGKVQLCNDTDQNQRVDAIACEELGIRSVLAIPVRLDSEVVGVLEVFSSEANVFSWRTIRHVMRRVKSLDIARLELSGITVRPAQTDSFDYQCEPVAHDSADALHKFDLQELLAAAWVVHEHTLFGTARVNPVEKSPNPILLPERILETDPIPHFDTVEQPGGNKWPPILATLIGIGILFASVFLVTKSGSEPFAKHNQSDWTSSGGPVVVPEAQEKMGASDTGPNSQMQVPPIADSQVRNAEWLKKAANSGDQTAQALLSRWYQSGVGVHRDLVRAYTWGTIAARSSGNDDDQLVRLRNQMTPAQLNQANHRIQLWFASRNHNKDMDVAPVMMGLSAVH